MIAFTYIAVFLLVVGMLLDILSLVWGFTAARGGSYKSGFIVIPFLLYITSTLILGRFLPAWLQALLCLVAFIVHMLCSQLLPALFDRIFADDETNIRPIASSADADKEGE